MRGGEVGVGFELWVVWDVAVRGAAAVDGCWGRFEGFGGELKLLGGV